MLSGGTFAAEERSENAVWREAAVLWECSHAHIAHLYGVTHLAEPFGTSFLVMEYCRAGSLQSALRAGTYDVAHDFLDHAQQVRARTRRARPSSPRTQRRCVGVFICSCICSCICCCSCSGIWSCAAVSPSKHRHLPPPPSPLSTASRHRLRVLSRGSTPGASSTAT